MSSLLTGLMLAGVAALVVVYMTYPRLKKFTLSAARFFKDLPPPRRDRSRLRWGKIQFTGSFFMQLTVLLLLLAALLWPFKTLETGAGKGFGLWFLVDTSASMSTRQRGKTRMAAAVSELGRLIDLAEGNAGEMQLCIRLSSLDMEKRDWLDSGSGAAARQAAGSLKPRALGTDLRILRRQLSLLAEQARLGSSPGSSSGPQPRCPITHVVVISDLPAPAWLEPGGSVPVTWRDISEKVDNVGFTAVQAVRNPLTGSVNEVKLTVTAFGAPPAARLYVTGPAGGTVLDQTLQWGQGSVWYGGFVPDRAGIYRLRLSPGGAYSFDDSAVIEVAEEQRIRVDWQLPEGGFVQRMGWVIDRENPHLRVVSYRSVPVGDGVPTLMVGRGYRSAKEKSIIRDFVETNPLIEDLNFDAVESLGIVGVELPPGFEPVLRGVDSGVWAACGTASEVEINKSFDQTFSKVWPPAGSPKARNQERAQAKKSPPTGANRVGAPHPRRQVLLVPGLPIGSDDIRGRVSAAFFFNALRILLQEREFPPLYTLTSPYFPEPEGNRLTLHEDEGNTFRTPRSQGRLDEIKPLTGRIIERPLWPLLLLAAALVFLVERVYALFFGK